MGWREKMGPAKFRGVPFYVRSAGHSTGRRNVIHTFPFKRKPYVEDMGPQVRTFTVEAYVIGDDYLDQRDRLLTALETEGPGELVHPYYGTRRVALASDPRVEERMEDGGMAVFSLEFIETDDALQPTAVVDAPAKVSQSAISARASAGAAFISRYVTDATMKDSVAGALRSATLKISDVATKANMATQELALMKRRVDTFTSSISSVVDSPDTMLAGLTEIFSGFTSSPVDVYDFDAGTRPPGTTQSRLDEQACFDSTQQLIQRLAVIQAAELAPSVTYDSYEDAVTARDAIADLLDEQMEVAEDDAFPALMQLRADLVKAVPGEDSDLPRLVTYTPPVSLPSLVIAHRLYGDVDSEQDLVNRNGVKHPGFVPGGVELEVLGRG
jgi:prophage DNA circulation protein